jgi:hypothetical protein
MPFVKKMIKIKLLCRWGVIVGCAADLSFQNDDNNVRYLKKITLQEIPRQYSILQCHMIE